MAASTVSAPRSSFEHASSGLAQPAPRRTYGRQRPLSPEVDDGPSTSALFTAAPRVSPAKGLLNRWSHANSSWRDSLDEWDASDDASSPKQSATSRAKLTTFGAPKVEPEPEETDDEEDLEAIKLEMEQMRRKARGEPVASPVQERSDSPIPAKETLQVLKQVLGGSSSLTSLPGSEAVAVLPSSSSPPRAAPRHSASPSFASSQAEARGYQRSASPGVMKGRNAEEHEAEDATETETHRAASGLNLADMLFGDDSDDEGGPATKLDRGVDGAKQDVQAFLNTLADEDEDGDDTQREGSAGSTSPRDPVGLFDDDAANGKSKEPKKIKPLNMKDKQEMFKDMARAERERHVEIIKPEAKRLPISSWLLRATEVIRSPALSNTPGLSFSRQSPKTSPTQTTPADDISAFTPSSADHVKKNTMIVETAPEAGSSSPTPHAGHTLQRKFAVPSTSDAQYDDDGPLDVRRLLEQNDAKKRAKLEVEEKRKQLQELKRKMLQRKSGMPSKPLTADDDDLAIELPSIPKRDINPAQPAHRRGPDAKAILHMTSGQSGHPPSKNRQAWLRRAGKLPRQQNQDDITETHRDFAGKAFNHAAMRNSHGGARPAGQKQGREAPVNQAQLDAMIRQKHQQQVIAIARKKEEEWGRGRALPERKQTDVERLVQMSIEADQRRAEREERDMEDEDEDVEDEDFAPDDASDGDENPTYSGEEDDVVYSGGEEEADAEAAEESEVVFASGATGSTDKENESPTRASDEDDGLVGVKEFRTRASPTLEPAEVDQTPRQPSIRSPLGETALPPQPFSRTPDNDSVDLAGLGSGDGSPGFSQLFEDTQEHRASLGDGFSRLRQAGAVGLLPSQALLPGIDISETQAERDNALIAAEAEAAMMDDLQEQARPAELYLNERGLFTQTKPASLVPTARSHESEHARALPGYRSEVSLGFNLSDTMANDPSIASAHKMTLSDPAVSPTQSGVRRSSVADDRSSVHLDLVSSPSQMQEVEAAKPRNAFEALMAARRAKQPKGPKKRSDLVDEQAEESDEDNGWGMLGGPDEDEDEDDEGYVPDLVDDQNIDEEEKKRQDDLAAAKAREIEEADDARREAEARKIIAGETRQKRKGRDFLDSDEDGDEDEEKRRRRMARKMRKRKRQLGKADGLDRLEGEENAFRMAYEEGLDSDDADFEEPEETMPTVTKGPEPVMSRREVFQLLRKRGEMNRGRDLEVFDAELDRDLGFDGAGFNGSRALRAFGTTVDLTDDDVEMEESQFSIARSVRTVSTSTTLDESQTSMRKTSLLRNTESYAEYVKAEAQITRRAAGVAGVSVVSNRPAGQGGPGGSGGPGATRSGSRMGPKPPLRKGSSSSSGGSILMSRGNRFA